MTTIAYLANLFPAEVEPYVIGEIEELRRRGMHVIATSVRRPHGGRRQKVLPQEAILYLLPVNFSLLAKALALLFHRRKQLAGITERIFFQGNEPFTKRLKALLHTWLGACYALRIEGYKLDHIHVHHGYFGSWIAMTAARLLNIDYSLTLHGSDLLVDGVYLDIKLKNCSFCNTVSSYNRNYILQHFPRVDPKKIRVSRIGVDTPEVWNPRLPLDLGMNGALSLLSVGRLHSVKNHEFLISSCSRLRDLGLDFECLIAGDGPEKSSLRNRIQGTGLVNRVQLLGHVPHAKVEELYAQADLVVLTSRSEGIPLVLMEAMAHGKFVLAPAITGIPELVIPGKTGFLYTPGMVEDFIDKVIFVSQLFRGEGKSIATRSTWIRHAAQLHVLHNFNRRKNLANFSDHFSKLMAV